MYYILVFLFTFVWVLTGIGCDAASVIRDDDIPPKKDQTSTPEYFFGLKVEPSLDELGRQIPFRGVDENGFPLVPDDLGSWFVPTWHWEMINFWNLDILKWEEQISNLILIDKVLIKLWNQGDHSFIAADIESGRVYPHYPNTIYVRWKERVDKNGVKSKYISFASSGGDVKLTSEQMRKGEIPPGIRVLGYDSGGYDAYEFLTRVELNAGCGNEVGGVLIKCVN